jgi:hypothetical protein
LPQGEISVPPDHLVGYAALAMPGIMAVRWTNSSVNLKTPLEGT